MSTHEQLSTISRLKNLITRLEREQPTLSAGGQAACLVVLDEIGRRIIAIGLPDALEQFGSEHEATYEPSDD